jgi:hypothetical protein
LPPASPNPVDFWWNLTGNPNELFAFCVVIVEFCADSNGRLPKCQWTREVIKLNAFFWTKFKAAEISYLRYVLTINKNQIHFGQNCATIKINPNTKQSFGRRQFWLEFCAQNGSHSVQKFEYFPLHKSQQRLFCANGE